MCSLLFFPFSIYDLIIPLKDNLYSKPVVYHISGCRGIWTPDLEIKSFLLYQLSYTSISECGETWTLDLQVKSPLLCQLSYTPILQWWESNPRSWPYEDPALTNWATLQVQTEGLEPSTAGLEIRCANPLRHVCKKVGMMGIEPIFTLSGLTAYKAVALTCWATSQLLGQESNLQPSP